MKTFLIVLVILVLLGIAIYLLMRKPGKTIEDAAKPIDSNDDKTNQVSEEKYKDFKKEDATLKESVNRTKEIEKVVIEEEVHIPEHCKIDKCDEVLPNKYFFNIHKYTSSRGKQMYCVVCSAVINNENYRIIVKNSYYPYLGSYTITLMNKIESMFENDKMSVEEFIKLGSTNFDNLGEIVTSF